MIESIICRLANILQGADLFDQRVALNINRSRSYSTKVGVSLCLLVILMFITVFNFKGFLQKENVFYTQETQFSPNPNKIVMDQTNFMAAFSIEQNDYIDNPMFDIIVEQRNQKRLTNGNLMKTSIKLELQPCTLDHFSILTTPPSTQFQEEFNSLNLGKWLCPKKDFQFNLSGTYTSQEFNYIKISVQACNDSNVSYQSWNTKCASDQQRQSHLATNGEFKLQIYQVNFVINPDQSEQYYQSYLDGEMYFTFLPNKLTRLANLYYRKYLFNHDEQLFTNFQSYTDQKELIVRQTADYRDLTELGQESDKNFAIVYLRRSQFSEFINRRFMKFDEFLSFIGGFKQILFTIFGFFVIFYNRKSMEIDIINKLYNFERQPNENAVKQSSRDSVGVVSPIKIENEFEYQDGIALEKFQNKESFLMDLRNLYKDTKIKKQLKLFLHQLFCKKLFFHPQQKLIDKGREQISKDFDIQEIIYLLQQVSTLKRVLFNEQQLIFFNLIPKPTLHKQKMEEIPSRLILQTKNNEQTNEKEFYRKWKLLRQSQTEMYNYKLLNLLEEDTKRILEAINIRENQLEIKQVHYPAFQPR